MRELLIYIFFSNFLLADQISCDKLVDKVGEEFLATMTLKKVDEIDNKNHYISASSTSHISKSSLKILSIDTKECSVGKQRDLKVYRAIVELFAINKGVFVIEKEIADRNHEEKKTILKGIQENMVIPVISNNKKYTKQYIQDILAFNGKDIDSVDIDRLKEKIKIMKENFSNKESLRSIKDKLFEISKDIHSTKKESVADFLFRIADNKQFYKNFSWLAMNFYDSIETVMLEDEDGNLLRTPFDIAKSDLITSDMNDTTNYIYFMDKNGNIDSNKSDFIDYHYFLSEDGTRNPRNELKATLHYFFDSKEISVRSKRIKKYENRYVLLKQLFKVYSVDSFPSDFELSFDISDILLHKYKLVYVTIGKKGDESYGHTMLHIYKGDKLNEKPIEEEKCDEVKNKDISDTDCKESNTSNVENDLNNSKLSENNLYINFGVPLKDIGFIDKIKGFFGKIYGEFTIHEEETYLSTQYKDRMVMRIPISIFEQNIDKKILFEAHIEHIKQHSRGQKTDNKIFFTFPYRFISKNCAYIMTDLLEVPIPEIREKFNNEKFFSFAPKDMFQLLKENLNVNQHDTKNR